MKFTKNYYSVYFEIYGKKLKANVLAKDIADAQNKVKDKIIFHKTVIAEDNEFNQAMDRADDLLDILKKRG